MNLKNKLNTYFERYAGGSAFELKFYNYMDKRGRKPNIDGEKEDVKKKMAQISEETLKEIKDALKKHFGIRKVMYTGQKGSHVDFVGFATGKDKKIKAYTISLKSYSNFYRNSRTAPQITGQAKAEIIDQMIEVIKEDEKYDEEQKKELGLISVRLRKRLESIDEKEEVEKLSRDEIVKKYKSFWESNEIKTLQKKFIETQFENLYKIANLTIGYDYSKDRFAIIPSDVELELPSADKIEATPKRKDWSNITIKVDGLSIATVQIHNKVNRKYLVFRFKLRNLEKFMHFPSGMIVGGKSKN